ncbi:MAG: replication-associated recombination protein A [Anaerovoracaceae bacterium]|jgi:putative ATPase
MRVDDEGQLMIPLSTKMRPTKLEEFVGQGHFLYEGSLLYNAIKNKTFDSAIFFGPSGTGKTSLARIIAGEMDAAFVEINASSTGTKELKELIESAKVKFFGLQKETTYVYVDEFHRWNKLQQDSLLKALEEGVLRFIGSTTENPYFAVNNAILSRVRSIYEFKVLDKEDIFILLKRTLADKERGLGNLHVSVEDSTLMILSDMAGGDGRIALDTLGFIVNNLNEGEKITPQIIEEAMQQRTFFYDKKEDKYNLLSALQKSVRGSDPDGAIHYLARLIEGGADIQMIGRRLLVMASEDVGMAYPNAISIVTSCVQAALMVGYPEAKINLAQAVITMAAAPKSNRSYMALVNATTDLKKVETGDVPDWLKDAHYTGAKKRGLGIGYQNPHDFGGYVEQQYLPDSIKDRTYYEPTENGTEASFKKYLENLKKK